MQNGLCADVSHVKNMRGRSHGTQWKIVYGIAGYLIVASPRIETSLGVHKVLSLYTSIAASKLDTLRDESISIAGYNMLD